MKIFISWSGERSKAIALALKSWLPMVLQYAQPWVSDSDIAAGDRWAQQIAGELEAANFGIICITPENLNSEWILFESGALSKSMQDGKVIPLLFDIDFKDISGPLTQFQAKKTDQKGLSETITAINKVSATPAADNLVADLLDALWPRFEAQLGTVPAAKDANKHRRNQTEVIEELVTGVRGLEARVRDVILDIPDREFRSSRRNRRMHHPMMAVEFAESLTKDVKDPLILLILAGSFREDAPWFAEMLTECYRGLRSTNSEAIRSVSRLRELSHMIERGHPLLRELLGDSKDAYMLMREAPRLLERVIENYPIRKIVPLRRKVVTRENPSEPE